MYIYSAKDFRHEGTAGLGRSSYRNRRYPWMYLWGVSNLCILNESAGVDSRQVSDKSNSATSLTQGLSAPLKLSKTRRLTPKDPSRRLTLRVTARTIRSLLGTVLKRTRGDEEGRFSVGLKVFSEKSPLSIVVLQYYGIL